MRHSRRAAGAVGSLVALALIAAACGGDDSSKTAATATTAAGQPAASSTTAAPTTAAPTSAAADPQSMDEWFKLWATQRDAVVALVHPDRWVTLFHELWPG